MRIFYCDAFNSGFAHMDWAFSYGLPFFRWIEIFHIDWGFSYGLGLFIWIGILCMDWDCAECIVQCIVRSPKIPIRETWLLSENSQCIAMHLVLVLHSGDLCNCTSKHQCNFGCSSMWILIFHSFFSGGLSDWRLNLWQEIHSASFCMQHTYCDLTSRG